MIIFQSSTDQHQTESRFEYKIYICISLYMHMNNLGLKRYLSEFLIYSFDTIWKIFQNKIWKFGEETGAELGQA